MCVCVLYILPKGSLARADLNLAVNCRPTFYRIYKKKSTEGFQSVPYVVALFSAMLWVYYAFVKSNVYLILTINSVGCIIETVYIVMFLAYASRNARVCSFQVQAKYFLQIN